MKMYTALAFLMLVTIAMPFEFKRHFIHLSQDEDLKPEVCFDVCRSKLHTNMMTMLANEINLAELSCDTV